MKTKLLFTMILMTMARGIGFAQVNQQWAQRYNGPGNSYDGIISTALDAAGNVYVAGYSGGSGTDRNYLIIKYNPAGTSLWTYRYNGPANGEDVPYYMVVDNPGNVYVTGGSFRGTANDYDFATLKLSTAGNLLWMALYNGPVSGTDAGYSIALDNSGNVFITGFSWGGAADYDIATIKYNSAGAQIWASRFNGTGSGADSPTSIVADDAGNIYIAGYTTESGFTNDHYVTIKYSGSGLIQWIQTYNGPGSGTDRAECIVLDGSNNVYVSGLSEGNSSRDITTIKYNSSGAQQWVRTYDGSGDEDVAYSMVVDPSGNVYVAGGVTESGFSNLHMACIKYNSSGNQQWVQTYNGPGVGDDNAYAIAKDRSNNIYITGFSTGNGTSSDVTTIKYNSAGTQQWVDRYNYPVEDSVDFGASIVVDSSYNVYVGGLSFGSGTYYDFLTLKYNQPFGIQPISSEIPSTFSLSQNYPNPFNATTKFKFQIPNPGNIRITIYDALGREALTLVDEDLNPGTFEADWDATNYPSGVYFYRMSIVNSESSIAFEETKKMVLIK